MKAVYEDNEKLTSCVNRKIARVFVAKKHQKANTYVGKAVLFTGVKTFGRFRVLQNQAFEVTLQTTLGRAKLILVNKQKQMVVLCENNAQQIVTPQMQEGVWKARFVGEKANATFCISRVVT